MPNYEFKCERCGLISETLCPSNIMPDTSFCPLCHSIARRIMSVPAKCVVKMAIHTDSGLPSEYVDNAKPSEIYERNLERQEGKKISPEDM